MSTSIESAANSQKPKRIRYVRAVGPRLRKLLFVVFALSALIGANSVYLVGITALEWWKDATYQDYFYQCMFLVHLVLGFTMVLPVIVFGIAHIVNAYNRPNRRAVRAGYGAFVATLLIIVSGILLTRLDAFGYTFDVKSPVIRNISYWAHVLCPLVAVWLYVLHRLAGKRIKWRVGASWAAVAAGFAVIMAVWQSQDPRQWNVVGPQSGEQYFFPSLTRTATGNFIPARALANDQYCRECHEDVHETWTHSAHKLASFNNPAYLFSVRETRKVLFARDGNVKSSRFCAGCHDPVPFLSGEFEDPRFDDPEYDLSKDKLAQAGVTCTVCHAITHINSPRGNGDYTIEEPIQYPFTFSDSTFLRWINKQLVKSKPAFHNKTFLKPLHKEAEFCSACHKVHLPKELNEYKFLRGQNLYDSYLLSGVSGHGAASFYYPDEAETNCNDCHMPLIESDEFGSQDFDESGKLTVHDHQFPSANTAIPYLLGHPESAIQSHATFNEGVMRVDIFGIKKGGTIAGELLAPIRPSVPTLEPGETYLLETVIRTLKMGHLFTEGTADSNQPWLDITVTANSKTIGRSGGMNADDGEVDPWSHFLNAYVIDREGNRIDRRNAQDIFVALYNNQIPPGAGEVVHYRLTIPKDIQGPVTIDVKLQFRKFDTLYMKHFQGESFVKNDLPIMTLATDRVTLPIGAEQRVTNSTDKTPPAWQRWNDYGIGLLRKGNQGSNRGELRQAEQAFAKVTELGKPDGWVNRARLYVKEGRLDEAVSALREAASHDPPAHAWSIAWFTGLVNKQNGFLDEAIADFKSLIAMDTAETRKRNFDFSLDYRVLNELGQTILERAKQERGENRKTARLELLREARDWFNQTLSIDPENVAAHYNLALIFALLGESDSAEAHRVLHAEYKVDDNARDRAVSLARRKSEPANHAAEAIVIYDLQREGAYELSSKATRLTKDE